MQVSFSLADIDKAAVAVLKAVPPVNVVVFHGEMGSGKTTLVGAICRMAGTNDITGSPTFSIINQYLAKNGQTIYHMDWYRLKDEAEAVDAGVEDALYSGNLCLVEWPDRAPGLLPSGSLHVYLEVKDAEIRLIFIGTPD